MQRLSFALLGFLLAACVFSSCPSLILTPSEPIHYDTISKGGTIPAIGVGDSAGLDSIVHDTVYLPAPKGKSQAFEPDAVQTGTTSHWVPKFFRSIYSDSLITIRMTAQMDDDTCKVQSIRVDYSLIYPDLNKARIPDLSGPKLSAKRQYFALAEPWTNGGSSGLFLGIQAQDKGTVYGGGYDPFNKIIKLQLGKKIGQ